MRNLVLLGERRRSLQIKHSSDDEQHQMDANIASPLIRVRSLCHFPCSDTAETATALLTPQGVLVRAAQDGGSCWISHLDELAGGEWFNLTYVDSIDALVCLSHGGGIVVVSPSTGEAELVGEFDFGLESGRWSPDGELLLLVTYSVNDDGTMNNILLTMNGQWEVLCEVVVERHVSRKDGDDTVVSACWRPDGTACAVSTVDVHDQTRRIRTYNRDSLALLSIGRGEDGSGKDVPNLIGEAGLAWASAGCSHLLTALQRKSKRTTQVVFFEPNGLRHREFPLRPSLNQLPKPTGLTWNVESDLLAVTLRESTHDVVQLWHRSNYHWYLKQELRFSEGRRRRVSSTKFHDERPYLLFVALYSDEVSDDPDIVLEWREIEFRWDPSTVAVSVPFADNCTALSIDGCTLNFTPLEKALVPPPMYATSLTMDQTIRAVAHSPPQSQQPVCFVVQLSDGSLVLLSRPSEGGEKSKLIANCTAPLVVAKINWTDTQSVDSMSLRNFLVIGDGDSANELHVIALCCPPLNGDYDAMVEISVEWSSGQNGTARVTKRFPLVGRVLRMINWSDSSQGALLEIEDGSLLEYNPSYTGAGGDVVPSSAEPLLEPCPWLVAMKNASNADHLHRLVVGLSCKSRLYCHDRLLADAASSFCLSPTHKFLCYATAGSHCQLRFLPLGELLSFDPLMGSDENQLLEGYEPRNVERGTRLVAVLPSHPTAILQMPRGNMEGIYPRALVLPYVMSKIDAEEYKVAFEMMRRQRVDLNLIVDMNPWHFLHEGVYKFVDQVQQIDYLNLFIATLKDMDVTQWKYKVPLWCHHTSKAAGADMRAFDFTTKVNQICHTLREIMIQRQHDKVRETVASDSHFLLPILSTFAKENPPKLENALTLIKDNAISSRLSESKKPTLLLERTQTSIQYLAFLSDYELLFATALGMYDYDLARAVGRNSQMDPKAYLALLKRLKALPTFYGRYEVDVRLKRYEMALSNIYESGVHMESLESVTSTDDGNVGNGFEQCIAFIEEHSLHRLGLELFADQADERQCIMKSLGEHMLKEKRFETALAIFLAAEPPDLDGAKRAARACGDWRYFFTVCVEEDNSGMKTIASEVAEEIAEGTKGKNSRRSGYVQAGQILLDYAQDVYGAVDMFIAAEKWSEGRRIACLHSRQDLAKKCIDAAVSYAQTSMQHFEDRTNEFVKANERYAQVLLIRKEAVRNGGGMAGDDAIDEAADDSGSLFSMASNASNASLRSTATSSSVSSVSSVISVGAVSSFSITSEHDVNKHKSKFNRIGRDKKKAKRKKKKSGRSKIKPGSQEELQDLVGIMESNCADEAYRDIIAETIQFLAQVGKLSMAREAYNSYNDMKDSIGSSQQNRIEASRQEKEEMERKARKEGQHHEHIVLPVEKKVDALRCAELPQVLNDFFAFLPARPRVSRMM